MFTNQFDTSPRCLACGLLILGALLTGCIEEFKESFDAGFKERYKEDFMADCSAAVEDNEELMALCICTVNLALDQLTVAELSEDALNKKIVSEKIVPQCR